MDLFYTPDKLPVYMMAKPFGAACNLSCDYCYYLDKRDLYPGTSGKMDDLLLERFVKEYIGLQPRPEVLFTWHGGEPLLMGIDFFKKVLNLQKYYGWEKQIRVDNSLQTNGLLLNDIWCEFFAQNHFLIGISLDGPEHCHDRYRKGRDNAGTHSEVIKGIRLLQKHGVEFNILSVVNHYNASYPLEVYHHFKELGTHFIQFTPVVERRQSGHHRLVSVESTGELAPWSVLPLDYGRFLSTIFDEWVRKDVGTYFVINFDSTLANWAGQTPASCIHAEHCGHAMVMEHNGDVFACDHFVFPEYKRGNIWETPLFKMVRSREQLQFGKEKQSTLPQQCLQCRFLFACNGECPKNRFCFTKDGEPGLNYLCSGLQYYFNHVAPYMDYMKEEFQNQRPPANVMHWIKNGML